MGLHAEDKGIPRRPQVMGIPLHQRDETVIQTSYLVLELDTLHL